jgi:tRNA-2-methylthio-N6-dimethylallyladenosine synthase
MLLGQNVNSYRDRETPSHFVDEGHSAEPGVADFPVLLREIDALGARLEAESGGEVRLDRIRYTTSHPIDASDALWAAMAESPRVCRQIHLPVQAGSDAVLRRMKRLYKRDYFLDRVASLRRHMPDVVITTDLIVGFCGETEEDFEQTLSLAREVRFDQAFMFMYSPRAGTPSAEHLPDDVPAEVKKERLARLIELQEQIAAEKNEQRVGKTYNVLVEGPAKYPDGWVMGRTEGDIIVNFAGDADTLVGTLVPVRIDEFSSHTLRGTQNGDPITPAVPTLDAVTPIPAVS